MFGVGVGIRVGGFTPISGGGGFDPDAQAFFDRVTTAGGTLTTTEKNATNQLVLDMKSAGIWSSMKAVYPMVGASAAACAQNLKSSSFTGTFSSGWTFASTGVTPNGTSAYMSTGLNPSTSLTNNNLHFSYYSRTNVNETRQDFNASDAAASPTTKEIFLTMYANTLYFTANAFSPNTVSQAVANTLGFVIGNTTANNVRNIWKGGTKLATDTSTNTTALPNITTLLSARANPIQEYSTKQQAFASIGDGLTDTQASNFYTAVQTFNQTLNRQVGPQIVSDADAQAYINRVYTAGGTLTNTEANAVNQLTIDMKAAGIWTAMKAVYPMVGSSAAACAQNLKSSSFTGTFTSGWTFASTGATPNGTSAFLNTGLQPSAQLTGNSTHVSYYSRTNTTTNAGVETGTWVSGYSYGTEMALNRSGAGTYLRINSGSTGQTVISGQNSQAFFIGSRTADNLIKFYRNTSTLFTNTDTATINLSTFNTYIGASNDFGTAATFSTKECAFASIGDGLTDTQASNFYTAVQAFQTTLARQV